MAMTISLLLHAALLLLLMYSFLTTPDPPLTGGEGMVVNLGYVDESTGEIQPMSENISIDPVPVTTPPTPSPQEENILTQQDEETESINITEKPVKDVKMQDKQPEVKEEKPVVEKTPDPRALYKGKTNGSTSQGTSDRGTGDQGSPDGDPNSKNYGLSGTGSSQGGGGKGPGWKLENRKPKALPEPEYNIQEEGKVAVEITVDKYGNVTNAKAGVKGSTTTNAYLLGRAKKAALSAKFNASPTGLEEQKGIIIYDFQLK